MIVITIPALVNLSFRNNADWIDSFQVYNTPGTTMPWANVPAWATLTSYQSISPASLVTGPSGDLYVANPVNSPSSWISADTFAHDQTQWLDVASSAGYGTSYLNLTGAVLKMTLAGLDTNSPLIYPSAALSQYVAFPVKSIMTLTSDGSDGYAISLPIVSASLGEFNLDLLANIGRSVPAGIYGYDLIAVQGTSTTVIAYGLVSVFQGANWS
jgi:hypothetical protein